MNQQTVFEEFRHLQAIAPVELVGLWKGRGIATGHPFDGVLENLGWFGKRFAPDLRADALLFKSGERRLIAINPSLVPVGLALRFHRFGRTRAARNLFSYLQRRLTAQGPVATLRLLPFEGVSSAAMVYDHNPIADYFRRIDADTVMGMMVIKGDDRRFFFELERVKEDR
ncbi:hypothetical protein DEM27_27995 [Metarhizobium album]|uniref:DUF4334 domain-containing protein n=1 Tax=Metarhizobium album TaxID=2182425 RepID=A0A2U2DHY8_9HYPH|nr:DUF4334 domain-containing protein [Rhizobium album]PWE52933.1 hypothetical protein DEM27_27995 [Rhizobium album]